MTIEINTLCPHCWEESLEVEEEHIDITCGLDTEYKYMTVEYNVCGNCGGKSNAMSRV